MAARKKTTSDCEGQALFYDAIWSADAVMLGLYEKKLVTGGHFVENPKRGGRYEEAGE